MKRRHEMPFGAALRDDGTTCFRLWAPAAARVDLALATTRAHAALPLAALDGGWFEAIAPDAPHGSRYAFRIDGERTVPDPASRSNPDDVHAPSMVVDPLAFDWQDAGWRGRPWHEAVLYELHVGTFTREGTFAAAIGRLDYLAGLGITAIELMPLADFPGTRNWGYDGVLPFAPDATYGPPETLKALVQAAHARGLMVLLDVVYNHFGPEGNYLHLYAPQFFNPTHRTPWGAAINFDGPGSRTVRDFFVHNALFWLEEYHFDGLRLDAVHAIADGSRPDIVAELAAAVRAGPGRDRHVHLVLENDANQARYLGRDESRAPLFATAQWNDDLHHAFHVLLTGERDGYYADYAERPLRHLGRALAEGFSYQGEASAYRANRTRGEPSVHLPATAFVSFLQTHDQVGNRAFGAEGARRGERLPAARAVPADALHGRGVRVERAVPLLLRLRAGPCRRGEPRPPGGVHAVRALPRPRRAGRDPRPERPGDVRALDARLARDRGEPAPRAARLLPRAPRPAPHAHRAAPPWPRALGRVQVHRAGRARGRLDARRRRAAASRGELRGRADEARAASRHGPLFERPAPRRRAHRARARALVGDRRARGGRWLSARRSSSYRRSATRRRRWTAAAAYGA
jgi:malto-oligosyltrehalose trehalohydrolase